MYQTLIPANPASPPRRIINHVLSCVALAIAVSPSAIAGNLTDCGNEGLRTCKAGDYEFWNQYLIPRQCEFDLKPEDGYCRNFTRRRLPKDRSWTGWAMDEQRYRIGINEPLNTLTTLGAHNAHSSNAQGFSNLLVMNQALSVTDSLQYGMRFLEVDPHYYKGAARLCHAPNSFLCLQSTWSADRLFSQLIRELANWLDANPGEVIIVKLDDHLNDLDLGDHSASILEPIQTYLGSKVFRGPASNTFAVWPTLGQLRSQGKQIIFISRNSTIGDGSWILPPTYFPAKDHPQDANLDNCTDAEGLSNSTRSYSRFSLLSEGRSMSNLADTTGLLDNTSIRKALACGFSALTLDFVNALNMPTWGYSQTEPDTRREASIWSWAPGNRGEVGPAMIRSGDARWEGRPVGEVHRYACANKVRAAAGTFDVRQDRKWKITRGSGGWGIVSGGDQCGAEYPGWEFAFPANSYQNAALAKVLAASGSSDGVWLKYFSRDFQPLPEPNAGPSELVFIMSPGGDLPSAQEVLVSGRSGKTISTQVTMRTSINQTWLDAALPGGATVLGDEPYRLSIRIADGAKQLPVSPSDYMGEVRIGYPGGDFQYGQVIRIRLRVRTASTTQLILNPPQPIEGQEFLISGRITSANPSLPVQGRAALYDIVPSTDPATPVVPQLYEYRDFCGTSTNSQTIPLRSQTLPAGKYYYSITYEDAGNCGRSELRSSETGVVEVNVVRRLATTPESILISMRKGGFASTKPQFSVAGVEGTSAFAISGRPDLFAVEKTSNSTGLVYVRDAARNLPAGVYNSSVLITDSRGSSNLPIQLTVTAPLSATSPINLLGASAAVFRTIQVTSDGTLPYTLTGNASWLVLPPGTLQTNQPVEIGANPVGLAPGSYVAGVTATSPLGTEPKVIRVNLEVVRATNIVSVPSGMRLTIDGQTVVTPASFAWRANTIHSVSAPSIVASAIPETRHLFESWSDSGESTHQYTASANGGDLKVTYRKQHLVQTSASPSGAGSVTVSPLSGDGYYNENASVTLTATAAAGYSFLNWSGTLSGNVTPRTFAVTQPVSAVANFNRANIKLAVQGNLPGGSITLDGTAYALPAALPLEAGKAYVLSAVSLISTGPGTRIVFQSWSNGGSQTQTFTAPNTDSVLTVNYRTEYQLNAVASPSNSGTVTGAGWYPAAATATLTATPAAGFAFANFSGGAASTVNPLQVVVTGSQSYVANFTSTQQPSLFATVGAGRTDGPSPGQRVITLRLTNVGPGGAADASVFEISGITVVDGTGAVSVATPVPVNFGTLAANQSANAQVLVNWPPTANRVRFNFRFTANGGTYTGSTALTLSR